MQYCIVVLYSIVCSTSCRVHSFYSTLLCSTVLYCNFFGTFHHAALHCHSHPQATNRAIGCSGATYQGGVREAARQTNPAIILFENVVGVAEWSRDSAGQKQEPAVKAWFSKQIFTVLYCIRNNFLPKTQHDTGAVMYCTMLYCIFCCVSEGNHAVRI